MRADEGLASAAVAARRPSRGVRLRSNLGTWAFWLLGSAVVVLAQPSTDRRIAAAGAAAAGVATILVIGRATREPDRRHFRSLIGAMVAVSIVGDWLVQHLAGNANGFIQYGLDTRIALPLLFVLLGPLVLLALPTRLWSRALWREHVWQEARPLDWLMVGYASLILPDLALGLAHHAPKSYIAQDLGLIVFFLFAYVAGRTISADVARACAVELVIVLLVVAVAQALFGFDTTPIFTYVEAACAGGIAFALLQPKRAHFLLLASGVALLANDAVAVKNGTGSTTAVELGAALGIVLYLLVRVRRVLPLWLVLAAAVAALAGFLAFTSDGATVRGQYHGSDQSNLGRTYEAHQVRRATHSSPVSFIFGRGLGGSIDETQAPRLFAESLTYGGRDLAHVQEVHLLPYEFLLKYGLLGFAWIAAFVASVAILGIGALETATRHRDPTLVVYAALPLLGVVAALAAATHLQDNPLNALAVGVLVTRLDGAASRRLRLGFAVPAAALICAAVGALSFGPRVPPFDFPQSTGIQWKTAAVVGDLRVPYPPAYHHRYFAIPAPKGAQGHRVRVKGVVIASYALKRNPELGGSGQALPADGVFLEVYQASVRRSHLAPAKAFPLTIFDLSTVNALRNTATTEQGSVLFSTNGHNYRVILWVGKRVPKSALLIVDNLINFIQVRHPKNG